MVLRELLFSTAVTWRCFSQVVVFLYLLDEKTSLLVQVPAGIATVIEVSSCHGAVNVCLYTLIHRLSAVVGWL